MRAKTTKVLRNYLNANATDLSETKLKSDLRKLKNKYNRLNRNERADFKTKLQDLT